VALVRGDHRNHRRDQRKQRRGGRETVARPGCAGSSVGRPVDELPNRRTQPPHCRTACCRRWIRWRC